MSRQRDHCGKQKLYEKKGKYRKRFQKAAIWILTGIISLTAINGMMLSAAGVEMPEITEKVLCEADLTEPEAGIKAVSESILLPESESKLEGIADISEKLAEKVDKNGILPLKTGTTDQNGTLIFQNLDPGLYLLQGKDTVKGNKCYRTTPSLLTISGSISEDVWTDKEELEVKPKCEITEETETEKETEASVGTETPAETPPTYPDDPGSRLPNTGRLLWPIPILSAAGLLLFVIGWKKRNRSKN